MQTSYTGYVVRSEWWWTTLISLTFILATFTPFVLLVFLTPVTSDIQFMGAMHDIENSAADIARMQQGLDGGFLVDTLYYGESQTPTLIDPLYVLLGIISRNMGLSQNILFHMMRIFISLFMYLAIYQLGATIWMKVRARRIFFFLASASAGFGWIFALFTAGASRLLIPDLNLPQAFPIYASAANIHYPLAIACIALITSVIIIVLRPGETASPMPDNGGGLVFISSLILAFIYPEALLPIGIAYGLNVSFHWFQQGHISQKEFYWGLWILVPALPIIAYNLLINNTNAYIATWLEQRVTLQTPIWLLAVSLGSLLLIALPALWRAVRRFEADGDRFMLLWLMSMVITSYLPIHLHQYLLIGITLPLGYFATRATEDFWFKYVRRRHQSKVYTVFIPILVLSHLFWIFLPLYPLLQGWTNYSNIFFEREYSNTLIEIDLQVSNDTVILASPDMGLWIPAWTGSRVVYGHSQETPNASDIERQVVQWYRATDPNDPICASLLEEFNVDLVIVGPRERFIGDSACAENLDLRQIFGEVNTYGVPRP